MLQSGILVIAHGSRDAQWVEAIDKVVQKVNTPFPIVVGYLELVPGRSISDGVKVLEQQGVKRMIVVPLFMTMGSTHLHEIQYALGLIEELTVPSDLEPIQSNMEIIWSSPLESHPLVLKITEEMARELSREPSEEIILLVGHGSEWPGFKERWDGLLQEIGHYLKHHVGFKAFSYATLKSKKLFKRSHALGRKNRVIVIPIFLGEGYFTGQVIPKELNRKSSNYSGKTLLPHPLITKWIEETIESYEKK